MRVTNTMLGNRLLDDLDRIRQRMYRLETDISTGVWLHRPSDSPADATAVIRYQETLERIKRYQANMNEAKAWMAATESAIADLIEIVHRAHELTVQGASDSNSTQSRESIRQEIEQLRRYAIQVGNATHNGQYIFSGFGTNEPAFKERNGVVEYRVQPSAEPQKLEREIGPGQFIVINVTGDRLGGILDASGQPLRSDDLFDVLQDIATALGNNDQTTLNDSLGRLNKVLDNLLGIQAELGAKQRTLELNEARTLDLQVTLEGQLESTRGTDMERALLDFNKARNAYEVALGMGARILPPTLLDYLR